MEDEIISNETEYITCYRAMDSTEKNLHLSGEPEKIEGVEARNFYEKKEQGLNNNEYSSNPDDKVLHFFPDVQTKNNPNNNALENAKTYMESLRQSRPYDTYYVGRFSFPKELINLATGVYGEDKNGNQQNWLECVIPVEQCKGAFQEIETSTYNPDSYDEYRFF